VLPSFLFGGYECLEWLEISTISQEPATGAVPHQIRVPREQVGGVFHIFGYAAIEKYVKYLAIAND